ncbi:RdRP-domain-containing protein [Mycena kentingensis (nom. inval.)]|nr:RdRP-domain-containing protein [Mycena kentingensis (nom. inval.)]
MGKTFYCSMALLVSISRVGALRSPPSRQQNQVLIDAIRSTPYVDPRRVQEERERREELSGPIAFSRLSFGRVCRDGVFSPESRSYTGTVACNMQTRRLDIAVTPPPQQSVFEQSIQTSVHIIGHRVAAFVVSGRRAFLQTDLPPTFQRRTSGGAFATIDVDKMAERVSGLDDADVVGVSAITCQTLCLEFESYPVLNTFLRRCPALHFPKHTYSDIRVEPRNCYDAADVERLDAILECLQFSLAFEVDKAIWAGVLETQEALGLASSLTQLEQMMPPGEAAIVFRRFVGVLDVPTLGLGAAPKSPRQQRRRRGRRQRLVPVKDLIEFLEQAIEAHVEETDEARGRYVASGGVYQSYHLILTPTTQILDGPLPDQSNSVLRRFQNNDAFLRVSFQDENRSHPRQDQTLRVSIERLLERRYKRALNSGLMVAGRHFEFLGYSMSGLKDYSFIFVTPFEFEGELLDAPRIRGRLGDFSKVIYQPALLGARWSQAFSSSDPSVTLEEHQIIQVDDRTSWTGSVFTDGCSSISSSLSRLVWKTQRRSSKIKAPPSALQFRCSGAKGVLVVNPNLAHGILHFRPSQRKFVAADLRTLDIATTSAKPILTHLNRPLIALLEHHGVPKTAFLTLQNAAIDAVHRMKNSLRQAANVFDQHGLGGSFNLPSLFNNIKHYLKLEIGDWSNPTVFQHQLIRTAIAFSTMHILREIKHRGHILIPGCYTLIGVADEWDCLAEGEIYATIVDDRNGVRKELNGRLLITRSPQIHPGDIQFVNAVRKPELEHLKNVVVFSCRGDRSLPSMLGGGDLDGDIYNLITHEALFPPKSNTARPGAYTAIPPKTTVLPCTVSDVVDFVIDYIKSDLLGFISILHLRIGDLKGYDCDECLLLAEKASQAVDFQKRGVPVNFRDLPKPPSTLKPDYLSGEGINPAEFLGDSYYLSKKVLGELYRNVPIEDYRPSHADLENQHSDGKHIRAALENLNLVAHGLPNVLDPATIDEELIEEMRGNMDEYAEQLIVIAKTYTTSKRANASLSEAELVSGTIQERYSEHKKRKEAVYAMNMQTFELVKAVRFEFQSPQYRPREEADDGHDEDDEEEEDEEWEDPDEFAGSDERRADRLGRAWAAWLVAEEVLEDDVTSFGASSFGLIALGTVLDVIKEADSA